MKHIILKKCLENIKGFYKNVAKKYPHTYPVKLMHQNINEAINSMYLIEVSLLRLQPTIEMWNGYYMANTKKWYFAYKVLEIQ